jgi:Fic family protein
MTPGHYEELVWAPDFERAGQRAAQAQKYEAFVPDPIGDAEPLLTSTAMALCDQAAAAVRELNAEVSRLISLEGVARQLLRSEALASSQIEGLSVSHRRLAEAELEGRQGPYKAREIMGTIRALEKAMAIGVEEAALSPEAMAAIHREIAIVPPLDKIAGEFRRGASWISGSSPPNAEYVGPPHEQVLPLLDDLCEFMNRDDISPIPQAAIAHAQFELIHPFGDGNGRVGRCLIHVLFRRRGIATDYVPPVSLVLGANKDAYIAGLGDFRTEEGDRWVRQFARAVDVAAANARKFSAAVQAVQSQWRQLVEPVRSDAAVLRLIEILPKYPIVTAAVAEKEINRSRPATISALDRLERVDVLTRRRNQRKGDSWEAKQLFGLLDDFEEMVRLPTGNA